MRYIEAAWNLAIPVLLTASIVLYVGYITLNPFITLN